MANIMNDNANWDDWLIGTWNSGAGMYEFNTNNVFTQTSTYGGTISPGDNITFDFITFGSVAPGLITLFINGTPVWGVADTSIAAEYDGITFPVTTGDSVQLYVQGGCCVYDFDFNIRPALPPGAFWTDFVGCHES